MEHFLVIRDTRGECEVKEDYIQLAFCRLLKKDNFYKEFGQKWIDKATWRKMSHEIIATAFGDYRISVDPALYKDFFDNFIKKLTDARVVRFEGDEYAGEHFKFFYISPNPVDKIIAENPVTKRVTQLGEETFRRALQAIDAELSSGKVDQVSGDDSNDFSSGDISIPASDRFVKLDHNKPEYKEIEAELAALDVDALTHGYNGSDFDENEKDRLLKSLDSARTFWNALQLSVVQIKVGIILALEDLGQFVVDAAKKVGIALLVDRIKTFTGLDITN